MAFFKMWAVGNGGMECMKRTVYIAWAESEDDLDGYYVEQEIGPLSGGVRSVDWELIEKPDPDLVQKEINKLVRRGNGLLALAQNLKDELEKD